MVIEASPESIRYAESASRYGKLIVAFSAYNRALCISLHFKCPDTEDAATAFHSWAPTALHSRSSQGRSNLTEKIEKLDLFRNLFSRESMVFSAHMLRS
jgi:hypothetical protein